MENVEKLNKSRPESSGKATSALFAGRHDRTQTKKLKKAKKNIDFCPKKCYNIIKERKAINMKQKEYKFIAHITHKDMTTEDNMFIDYTASARCRAKKVAQRPDVESVHLYRIDKTEIFA